RRAGCRTVFLDRGYAEPDPAPPADFTADHMATAAAWILDRASIGE
ncbi:MAG: hypothetical protein QOD49_814, partial [Actinomycetota bacterium]|nr:hypothetical protein [Actinomycetota bacterium]